MSGIVATVIEGLPCAALVFTCIGIGVLYLSILCELLDTGRDGLAGLIVFIGLSGAIILHWERSVEE